MAIEIKTIPVLHGEAAARFVEAADEALEKRGSIDFSKQVGQGTCYIKTFKTVHLRKLKQSAAINILLIS